MSGNAIFQVYLPQDCFNQLKSLCTQRGWTHGLLLGTLVENCPSILVRETTPPLHIKKSASPIMFKAHIDSVTNSRIAHICQNRSWSRRDMMIHLLNNYMEINHG